MSTIFLAAKGLAEMMRNDETTFEQTGLPRVYKTTEERLRSDESILLKINY